MWTQPDRAEHYERVNVDKAPTGVPDVASELTDELKTRASEASGHSPGSASEITIRYRTCEGIDQCVRKHITIGVRIEPTVRRTSTPPSTRANPAPAGGCRAQSGSIFHLTTLTTAGPLPPKQSRREFRLRSDALTTGRAAGAGNPASTETSIRLGDPEHVALRASANKSCR